MLSDIHGNIHALRRVVDTAPSYDHVVVLGDIVGLHGSPESIDLIRSLGPDAVLSGDADRALTQRGGLRGLPSIARLAAKPLLASRPPRSLVRAAAENPPRMIVEFNGSRLVLAHGTPRRPVHGSISPRHARRRILSELSITGHNMPRDIGYVLVGHTHEPYCLPINGLIIGNPGSVGLPGGGDPRASYGILDTEKGVFRVYKAKYDVDSVLRELRGLFPRDEYEIISELLLTGSWSPDT